MRAIKSICTLIIICMVLTFLSSCNNPDNSKGNQGLEGWNISVLDSRIDESLESISTSVGYGGGTSTDKATAKPGDGKTFLLVKLNCEKKDESVEIDWKNMSVEDSTGRKYSRMEDSFLEEVGFKRMKGTPINFGTNEGWMAFEIDKGALNLKLNYTSEEGSVILELK